MMRSSLLTRVFTQRSFYPATRTSTSMTWSGSRILCRRLLLRMRRGRRCFLRRVIHRCGGDGLSISHAYRRRNIFLDYGGYTTCIVSGVDGVGLRSCIGRQAAWDWNHGVEIGIVICCYWIGIGIGVWIGLLHSFTEYEYGYWRLRGACWFSPLRYRYRQPQ